LSNSGSSFNKIVIPAVWILRTISPKQLAGSIVYNGTRSEYQNLALYVFPQAASTFVADRRWKIKPLEDRSQPAEANH
jgi:hypothetical protein